MLQGGARPLGRGRSPHRCHPAPRGEDGPVDKHDVGRDGGDGVNQQFAGSAVRTRQCPGAFGIVISEKHSPGKRSPWFMLSV